jgi:hypothetical protein
MKAKRWWLPAISCLVITMSGGGAAAAPDTALSTAGEELHWNGVVGGPVSVVSDACRGACDEFPFEISLPDGTWRRDGGVQVAIPMERRR